jgi:DNA-binding transcriptional ArsR family regulator
VTGPAEAPATELECVDDPRRARALLDPLRLDLLRRLRSPRATTELADEVGMPRQRLLYHLKALHRAAFLRKAGRRRKRGCQEQRWVASASGYVMGPDALGPLGVEPRALRDRISASYLVALATELIGDVTRASREARAQQQRLATMAIDAELRFESAAQRERFAVALRDAIVRVVSEHASPAIADGGSTQGRPYRLMLGCWPVPLDPQHPFGARDAAPTESREEQMP